MRAIIQRVTQASVRVDGEIVGAIDLGLLVLFGVAQLDTVEDIAYLADKIASLRIFSDANNKMNLNVKDIDGDILVVSQFTLFANTSKGHRPSFVEAGDPEKALDYYHQFCTLLSDKIGKKVAMGIFGASMDVSLTNQGPVTISIDTALRKL